ncbi:hypothetical protein B0T26DRAFT_714457 [Lasiosphaeria miniovina]|uniref:Secreted protein n=1 Tax=Lasiosphaeria miniovina TaxID=1954250 RepID=A0AA40AAT6_9PEZI|nr:uncharacterized protein B0T26DRAFT_714457 [Lasiosphaeria miniovina]KAK0712485.1 hypothetical protein B0T26DRAFT_714457 [Lasiosphaeria miniovina]
MFFPFLSSIMPQLVVAQSLALFPRRQPGGFTEQFQANFNSDPPNRATTKFTFFPTTNSRESFPPLALGSAAPSYALYALPHN